MGNGYWILLWDGFGWGLVMENPRLLVEGIDMYGNPKNWFPCDDSMTKSQIIEKHNLTQYSHAKIIMVNEDG